jgi:hypothetical protein
LSTDIEIVQNIGDPTLLHPPEQPYYKPSKENKPSIVDQVMYRPIRILDPYALVLQRNYYYALTPEDVLMMTEMIQESTEKYKAQGKSSDDTPSEITVEHLLDTILKLLKEFDVGEVPTQIEIEHPMATKLVTPSSYCHRFAIYRRNTGTYAQGNPSMQLNLFRSFTKCIKSINNTAQILPIRNDVKIFPLSTIDQINNLELVGIMNHFKPYKQTKKTLSGDFHIATKLTFEALQEHQAFQTWLLQNGYSIIQNGCQTADMVWIGFLSRIQNFTYRDDSQDFIINSTEWKKNPFHFCLYFDT